jgi:hypothetical protein
MHFGNDDADVSLPSSRSQACNNKSTGKAQIIVVSDGASISPCS